MTSRRERNLNELRSKIKAQRDWIRDHGGDRGGYVVRYGDSGAGADAIFEADMNKLRELEEQAASAGRNRLMAEQPRICQECAGRGEVGPSDDRFVCSHCGGSGHCPPGCDWSGSGFKHRPAERND